MKVALPDEGARLLAVPGAEMSCTVSVQVVVLYRGLFRYNEEMYVHRF